MAIKSVTAIINGQTSTMNLNEETGLYELVLTAPDKSSFHNNEEHYFPITIKAEDDAGNLSVISSDDKDFGQQLRLFVKEKEAPAIIISSPTEDQITSSTQPVLNFTVTDNDSGVKEDTIEVRIDNPDSDGIKEGIQKTEITKGYSCSYTIGTPLKDGSHTFYVDAQDNDGNKAIRRTVNFKVDTVPPELSVESPLNNYATNQEALTVWGYAKDATTAIKTLTIQINGGEAMTCEVNTETGYFSKAITLTEGANTIAVKAVDMGGFTSSVTRVITLDTKAPIIQSVEVAPNPVGTQEIVNVKAEVLD